MSDKVKMIWVVAQQRGQNPMNMAWVDENALPFQIAEAKFSKRWMKKIEAKEAKALLKAAGQSDEPEGDADGGSEEVDALKKQIADLTSEKDQAVEALSDMITERDAAIAERDKMDEAGKALTKEVADLKDKVKALEGAAKKPDPEPDKATDQKPADKQAG